jgi:hypothetical protein
MGINDVLARLLEMLGIKQSESRKYAAMETKLRANKAANVDRLEGLKEQIAMLIRQAKAKKKEYDAAVGDTKRIVQGEIERLFGELDRLKNRETIIGRNISQLDLAIGKLLELQDAKAQGVDPEMLDSIAVELEDIFAELKTSDRAKESLDKVNYQPKQTAEMDIEARVAELEAAPQKEATPQANELSRDTLDRLKELAADED